MQIMEDLRYAFRLLRKTPAVTLVAMLSLALGIGANTAIFGVIDALLLRSLPVEHPQRLVRIGGIDPGHPKQGEKISPAMLNEIREHADVFSNILAWFGGSMGNFEANGVKYAGSFDEVSGDYFAALGVRPVLGRVLTHDDAPLDGRRSAQIAVIGYGCWQHRFDGDPNVIGKTIRLEGTPLRIVGVSPKNFTGLMIDVEPEATVPIGFTGREIKYRESLGYEVLARLKPAVSVTQARAQIQVLWPGILRATVPDSYRGGQRSKFFALRADVQPAARGDSYLRERLERPLEILMALVGAVLLIACVNLANLLLARGAARQHEFGIRAALGAARWPLVRMMLTEALLLSCTGAAFGLLIARWTARYLLASFWTGYVPLSLDPSPDVRVLVFTTALALFTGVLFGIVPAWRMSRSDPARTLSQGPRTTGGHMGRFSKALVTAQVVLSLVLLIGAALFVRSLQNLHVVDLGYRRDHLLLMQLFPQPEHEKIPNRTQYYHELVTRISQVPGVESVSYLHMGPASSYEFKAPVSTGPGRAIVNAVEEWAGPGFFHMIGMRVLAGREFDWRDDEHAPPVAVIGESLARTLFANQNPIGRTIDLASETEHKRMKIIGVVNSASLWKLDSHAPLALYQPVMQDPRINQSHVVIRTLSDPRPVAPLAERTLESLGHHYSLRTETLEQRTNEALVLERMIALLASVFSVLALVLAAVGLYGIQSYAVTRRTAEIGVRMALGASRSGVLRMIFGEALRLISIGIAIAVPVAFAGGKLVTGMLFGVSAKDPAAVIVSSSILLGVAAVAGFLPAHRASRVDPMTALRCE